MKLCPHCKATYPDDANFCPQEGCATPTGPQRLQPMPAATEAPRATSPARFQLGPRLGGGNTGEVYRATDTQTGAQVAYKIVNFEVLPNPAAVARAERELKQLMRVQSPRIAAIVDCGRNPDERLYVAMELVEGEPLDRLLKGGALPLDRAKAIVAQIGQALLEAQKAGIVHRDVAPKNVIVDMSGDVKVINFPVAKPINDKAAGVAAYLSPEQVQGKPVDQRSNTYSLAALFYHLITGEPPFQGTPETVLELHLTSPPLAPSQRRPQAGLTADADRVILKALDKSSSRRHLTLRLFLSEVDALTAPAAAPVAAAAGAAGKDGAGAGFARTMLFAGGQAEVANLVARAIASRSGSPAGGVPVSGAAGGGPDQAATPVVQPVVTPSARRPAPASAPTPGPASKPPSGPEQLPTTVPLPILNVSPAGNGAALAETNDRGGRLTPPPVTPYPPGSAPSRSPAMEAAPNVAMPASPSPVPAAKAPSGRSPGPAPVEMARTSTPPGSGAGAPAGGGQGGGGPQSGGKGAAFRETLWFKKGDVEHMIAEARAKMSSQGARPGAVEPEVVQPGEDIKPIEDRYVDDGSLTTDDRKKFSLRTGGTAASIPTVKPGQVPGEAMTEHDVIREVSGSRRAVVIAVAAIVVAAIVAVVMMMMQSKPMSPAPPRAPAAAAVPGPNPTRTVTGAAATAPTVPAKTSKRETKIVAAPPSKRSDSDKRDGRRKTKSPDRRKRR
jgi:eukaryotic-like serine/threonine-protein kinase